MQRRLRSCCFVLLCLSQQNFGLIEGLLSLLRQRQFQLQTALSINFETKVNIKQQQEHLLEVHTILQLLLAEAQKGTNFVVATVVLLLGSYCPHGLLLFGHYKKHRRRSKQNFLHLHFHFTMFSSLFYSDVVITFFLLFSSFRGLSNAFPKGLDES